MLQVRGRLNPTVSPRASRRLVHNHQKHPSTKARYPVPRNAGTVGPARLLATRGRHGPRVAATLILVFHNAAVVSGGLAVPPSSVLERSIADLFTPYYGLADLGYAYASTSTHLPTPVVTLASVWRRASG